MGRRGCCQKSCSEVGWRVLSSDSVGVGGHGLLGTARPEFPQTGAATRNGRQGEPGALGGAKSVHRASLGAQGSKFSFHLPDAAAVLSAFVKTSPQLHLGISVSASPLPTPFLQLVKVSLRGGGQVGGGGVGWGGACPVLSLRLAPNLEHSVPLPLGGWGSDLEVWG